ncbi:MAG: DUF2721 domain-containing protein [Alphaproteobacteria bacterium]|nr:DUF2721 domain-containing protein [Alphaproteobacteria bacterium]
MGLDLGLSAAAHAIQLSVAPVFLLASVGAMLAVLSGRLGRVIDRARVLEARLEASPTERRVQLDRDLASLAHRASLMNRAITLVTICGLLVCTVIAALFVAEILALDLALPISLVFVLAMLALIGGLLTFLREVHIATRTVRIGLPRN